MKYLPTKIKKPLTGGPWDGHTFFLSTARMSTLHFSVMCKEKQYCGYYDERGWWVDTSANADLPTKLTDLNKLIFLTK